MCGSRAGSASIGRLNGVGKRIYKRRKETVERSFADAKQLHGHRYARMRGLSKVQQQCLLAATAQNIKKIALLLSRMGPHTSFLLLQALVSAYSGQLRRYQQLATANSDYTSAHK
jgi:hypothetical protein